MCDYSKCSIYKLVDETNNNEYYGSTKLKLLKRLRSHERCYRHYLAGKYHYVSSFEILKNNKYKIILLEELDCKDRDELLLRESVYIKNSPNCVNKYKVARRTEDEDKQAVKLEGERRNGVYVTCECCNKQVSKRNISTHRKKYHL